MQLVNLTPFPTLAFNGIDARDREYNVVVMRVTYQLSPIAGRKGDFEPVLMESEPPSLEMEDRYIGKVGESSLICESDLAPFKPKCDVLLLGTAHAPEGKAVASWPVHLRLSVEPPHHQGSKGMRAVLLDKMLRIHGPRRFEKSLGGWHIRSAEPAACVPLRYELSYGGRSSIHHPADPEHSLNEVCFQNPLGRGWQHASMETQARRVGVSLPDDIPAPQIEPIDAPINTLDRVAQPMGPLDTKQMARAAQGYKHRPAGFGPIGRAWTPRIQKAGTYDDNWTQHRWPYLPGDFDMAYWNCAPEDQQIDFPSSSMTIELLNLTDPALTSAGYFKCQLPGHRAAILFRLRSGLLLGASPVIDTIYIDTSTMTIALVWRAAIAMEMEVTVAEARFERDPCRELLRMSPRHSDNGSERLEATNGR